MEDAIAARDWLVAQVGTILGPPEGRRGHDGVLVIVVDARRTHSTLLELREERPSA